MVKPKENTVFKIEDYLYLDEYGVLRWKIRYGRMCKGDIAGRHYSDTRHEVCLRGTYYSVSLIKDILENHQQSNSTIPEEKAAPATPKRPSWFAFSRIGADSPSRSRIAPKEGSAADSIRDIVDGE
jgi:hypothetical protein